MRTNLFKAPIGGFKICYIEHASKALAKSQSETTNKQQPPSKYLCPQPNREDVPDQINIIPDLIFWPDAIQSDTGEPIETVTLCQAIIVIVNHHSPGTTYYIRSPATSTRNK